MDTRVGQELGNYRLVSFLAVGAFAEIYLGEHIHLGTRAAVKVLHNQLTADQIELFRTEARIIASLVHPNIVRVLDYGVEDMTSFLILEYAPNGTMEQQHRRFWGVSPLLFQPAAILPYVKQVASALQYGHNQGFIHGQVQPSNMLLGSNNQILLSHFRYSTDSNFSLIYGKYEIVGTLGVYTAPELMEGQLSPSIDQYALGAIVYEWLSGERLFKSYSTTERMLMQTDGQVPSIHDKVPTVSSNLEQVVMKTLAQDAKQRFPSIENFANAFERACQEQPYSYDVALSYAGEDRKYAEVLANSLRDKGIRVFYDKYEKTLLWGEDLYTYLSDLYQNKAHYCVLFLSKYYVEKVWTKHELKAAQARALKERNVYMLPIRLDDTEVPGILPTIAYIDWHEETVDAITNFIIGKIRQK